MTGTAARLNLVIACVNLRFTMRVQQCPGNRDRGVEEWASSLVLAGCARSGWTWCSKMKTGVEAPFRTVRNRKARR